MVNSQETVLTIKMVFAEPLLKTAMLRTKFNWTNSIAIDANHAQLVSNSIDFPIVASFQHQL
jgi:hypothetical protein